MQDKLKETLKNISIFTTDPDKDWRRIFITLMCLVLGLLTWSFFFYGQINKDIAESETQISKNAGGAVSEKEDELRSLVVELKTKKQKNEGIVDGAYVPAVLKLSDPSR
ncbi:MAG: hypothetical protein KBB54_00325 [Candidatus Pacebacteria bacterium]|nr:hypothetical protein [Candidatus Paceibacterota bacterium]MBP9818440.1 hypothetical protein [Candidatus Paceibacterota bacterium]